MGYKNKIIKYLRIGKRGKYANKLERQSLHNPFLYDALEGFTHYDEEQTILDIEGLEKKISKKVNKHHSNIRIWLTASAAILLIFITGFWLLKEDKVDAPKLAVVQGTSSSELKEFDVKNEEVIIQQKMTKLSNGKNMNVIEDSNESSSGNISRAVPVKKDFSKNETERQDKRLLSENIALNDAESFVNDIDTLMVDNIEKEKSTTLALVSKVDKFIIDNQIIDVQKESQVLSVTSSNVHISAKSMLSRSAKQTDSSKLNLFALDTKPESLVQEELTPVEGFDLYNKYLKNNLLYPHFAKVQGVEGEVALSFLVNNNKRPYDIKVESGLTEECNAEGIRLVMNGPDWVPSRHDLKKRVIFKIQFKLVN